MNLTTEVQKGGYHIAGAIMLVVYSDPSQVPEEELLWEVWVPVAYPGPMGAAENDKMGFKYVDPMFVAYTYHIGAYGAIDQAYKDLFAWAGRTRQNIVGPPVEMYWSDPMTVPEEKLVTEIWLPVEEKKIPGGVVD
jgi:effector-binding domain-containing protein